jgi:PilZ domain
MHVHQHRLDLRDTLDQRRTHRHTVRLKAHVKVFGRARIPCEVHNIASTGALIVFPVAIALPEAIRLDIDADLFEAQCEICHRSGGQFGVRFTSNLRGAFARYG